MNITVIDFETYYDQSYSLKKCTIPEYVNDPRFHVHGVAIHWPDGTTQFRPDVSDAIHDLQDRFGEHLEDTTIVCHHAHFDLYVLARRCGIHPRYFIDTMQLAHHVHGRRTDAAGNGVSLAALTQRYRLPSKGDIAFMSGVREPDVKQLAELKAYAKNDARITASLAERLLRQIDRPEVEIPIMMHTVRLFTERGVLVDIEAIPTLVAEVRRQTKRIMTEASLKPDILASDKQFAKVLQRELARTNRQLPMKRGKNGLIPAIAKKDQPMQELLEDDDPAVAALARGRLEKKSEDQTLSRLDTLRRIGKATSGILPPYLVYYGAHTGRFAGGGRFNVQNLGRDGVGKRIRGLLIPRQRHVFLIADFAQVEARITAWYAGQDDLLEAFREGRDVYSEFASEVFDFPVRKTTDADSAEIHKQHDPLRQVGKSAVLGLGFQMGALKFLNTLLAEPKTAHLFSSGRLTPLICRHIVRDFRSKYPRIPLLWNDLDDALRASVEGTATNLDKLTFERRANESQIVLPSGRTLRYPDLRLEERSRAIRYIGNDGLEDEFVPDGSSLVYGQDTPIYSGKICENVVSATARDLLVEAILRLEGRGFKVVFHVHDEVIVEVEGSRKEIATSAVQEELSFVPPWATGLHVGCEVRETERYGK